MSSYESFCKEYAPANNTQIVDNSLKELHEKFASAQIVFCVVGIAGNLLNLRTLQCPSLQTVPFMYIRALAFFDLVALTFILVHAGIIDHYENPTIMHYRVYFEPVLINTFLVAGLYCAFMLTLERYMLISQPYAHRHSNPRRKARIRIFMAFMAALVLHVPIVLQSTLKIDEETGRLMQINNKDILCKEPWWTLFCVYKGLRECIRFVCVFMMTILNGIIARNLQIAKRNRRQLLNKAVPTHNGPRNSMACTADANQKREFAFLMKSFTEKKLTGLMIAICFIFILGNVPQIIVMVLQNEALEQVYGFQVYRNTANLLEVVNHCLNFYVFCMASTEYMRAFLMNCSCLRRLLMMCPLCAGYINKKRSSSFSAVQSLNNSTIFAMKESEETDDVLIVEGAVMMRNQHAVDLSSPDGCSSSQNYMVVTEEVLPRKGILRKEYRTIRRTTTIKNTHADDEEDYL